MRGTGQTGGKSSAEGYGSWRLIGYDCATLVCHMNKKLPMPVLAVEGAQSIGSMEAVMMRNAAVDATDVVISDSCQWSPDDAPGSTISTVRNFLERN